MFTGIIESQGIIKEIRENGTNLQFWIKSPISSKLKTDQSVSHDGVCLTVESVKGSRHKVTAVAETLQKTNLSAWQVGHTVNLERCLKLGDRLDGHLVQGHVDTTGVCINKVEKDGSWEYQFNYDPSFAKYLIEKGSITVNGISLTAYNTTVDSFSVAIIPYTFKHTNLKLLESGNIVNIEFDMIGKYIQRKLSLESTKT